MGRDVASVTVIRLSRVWEATCPRFSPVIRKSHFSFFATFSAILNMNLLHSMQLYFLVVFLIDSNWFFPCSIMYSFFIPNFLRRRFVFSNGLKSVKGRLSKCIATISTLRFFIR